MSEIELVIPFCLPPVEMASDLLRDLALPALATLLAKSSKVTPMEQAEPYARCLPHEQWLARRFGMGDALEKGGSPAVGALLLNFSKPAPSAPSPPNTGYWLVLQPVHLHVARDHLVLTDTRQLSLSDADSQALFDSAAPYFTEVGMTLHYWQADYWLLQADQFRHLRTATPDAACGHNIDIWMPQGDDARAWRKLQNEIQMDWHTHAVNARRADAGMVAVNSVWCWGGGGSGDGNESGGAGPRPFDTKPPTAVFNFLGWLQAFATVASASSSATNAKEVIAHNSPHRLAYLDALVAPGLASDWNQWRTSLQWLEAHWFAPMLEALRNGQIDSLSLVLTKSDALRHVRTSQASLRKFWAKPSLARISS